MNNIQTVIWLFYTLDYTAKQASRKITKYQEILCSQNMNTIELMKYTLMYILQSQRNAATAM